MDPQKILQDSSQMILRSAKRALNIPTDVMDTVRLLKDGNLSVHVEISQTPTETRKTQRNWVNAIRALIMIGLYLLAGLTITAPVTPAVLGIPWISFAALAGGVVLMIFILASLRKMERA